MSPAQLENGLRAFGAVGGHRARAVEAEERGIGRLVAGRVLAGRLAELVGAALDVENVVDDLKRQADLGGPVGDRLLDVVVGARP